MSEILHVADEDMAPAGNTELPVNNGKAIIKVIGIGGGGSSAVQYMIEEKVKNVEFIAVNTDLQALNTNLAEKRIQIGVNTTRGLGSGSKPEVGRAAAEESREDLKNSIGNADIAFITAGMGGGTGTGASPIVAQIVKKELGALTVAIVTKPYSFEGKKQKAKAEDGIRKLREEVDALIVIPNDKLLKNLPKNISLFNAFMECNRVLKKAVKGMADIIECNGYINLDFNDIKTILAESGTAVIGMGSGEGPKAAIQAINDAVKNPLLEDFSSCKARGLLACFTVGPEFPLTAYSELGETLTDAYGGDDTDIKYGLNIDSNKNADQIDVVVVLTGLEKRKEGEKAPNTAAINAEPLEEEDNGLFGDGSSEDAFFHMTKNDEASDNLSQESLPNLNKGKSAFDDDDFDLPPFLKHVKD